MQVPLFLYIKCHNLTFLNTIFVDVMKRKRKCIMHDFFDLSTNDTLFVFLMALTPIVFATMLVGSGSAVAAAAVAVAYASVLFGERLG